MDTLIAESLKDFNVISPIATVELVFALLTCAALTLLMARTYMTTHAGYSYSKSYVQALVLVGITITLIMIIIGSNIARAFALVGAMSIVRFRNPVKDSRDLVFIFMSMAIGMACGTRFYLFAAIFTAFSIGLLLVFHFWDFGALPTKGYVLKVRLKAEDRPRMQAICDTMCTNYALVSIEREQASDGYEDVLYEVEMKRTVAYDAFVQSITDDITSASVSLLVGESNVQA